MTMCTVKLWAGVLVWTDRSSKLASIRKFWITVTVMFRAESNLSMQLYKTFWKNRKTCRDINP